MSDHTGDLTIALATPTDWPRTRAIRLAALAADRDAFGSTLEGERDQPRGFWVDRIRSASATLLAMIDGADVGVAVLARAWTEQEGDVGMYGVWVDPAARGGGVGRALVARAVEVARGEGFERIVLEVADDNAAAVALYDAMGFAPTGQRRTMPPPREHITEHMRALPLTAR